MKELCASLFTTASSRGESDNVLEDVQVRNNFLIYLKKHKGQKKSIERLIAIQ